MKNPRFYILMLVILCGLIGTGVKAVANFTQTFDERENISKIEPTQKKQSVQ